MKIIFQAPMRIGINKIKSPKNMVSYYTIKNALGNGYIDRIIAFGVDESKIDGNICKKPLLHWSVPFILNKLNNYFKFYDGTLSYALFDRLGKRYIKNADIFHSFPLVPQSFKYAKKQGITTIVQGTIVHPSVLHSTFKVKKSLKEECIKNADYIFSLSAFAKKTYLDAGFPEDNVIDISFGVDERKFKPGRKKDDIFRGLFVGSVGKPIKGVKYLLKAWKELNLHNSELVLCGSYNEVMKQTIDKYKDKINVKTTGYVDPLPYYQNASIFIMPSLSEGFGKVSLEAMASGLPIIVTKNTGASTIITEGKEGFIVPIKDANAIKEKIKYFYDNQKDIKRMGKNARSLIESNYTWDHYSKRVADAYEKVYEREH